MTTSRPSDERWTSHSIRSQPAAMAERKDRIVFSGWSAGLPRCPPTSGRPSSCAASYRSRSDSVKGAPSVYPRRALKPVTTPIYSARVTASLPQTIGELRASGHRRETVKEEMRRNLLMLVRSGEQWLAGIVGYDDPVLPQLANAIISGHDVILLGERGQAKSRIMRSLVGLLDEAVPAIAGCEITDHPYDPICRRCLDLVAKDGDSVAIAWIGRDRRYGEKLATPDISIADLIGEVDPIKVAEGRYLAD